ncbi:hypothetical protein CYMTET_43165 [Cymbomonas tetramitiformis]|uniref:Polycystin cation channel PKD1/PKD2 domain-containing protein n=1 Tax=Cymbomonas tetramitiformis TaxID=36881 RepID=A0AAE0C4T9_9CHLO|nr:hypothetical protein CYMTET_43165 [Cymbomonas tetramitiformis]
MNGQNVATIHGVSHKRKSEVVNTTEQPTSSGHIANEDDQKVTVVAALRETYGARFYQRERYLHLIGFLAFIALYFAILLLQSNPGQEYRAREGMYEAIVPQDENGDPLEFFLDENEIYSWLSEVIEATWVDPICGDAWCEAPFEFPSFSTHGCQADCGEANGTNFTVILEPRFLQQYESESLEAVTYNLCTQDVEPLCWWEIDRHFKANFKLVEYHNLSLPDGVWRLQVNHLASDHGLVMGGIAESPEALSLTSATARRSRRRRALLEEANGGGRRRPGPRRIQIKSGNRVKLRRRTLSSDNSTGDADGYSEPDSNSESDYDISHDVMPSEWTTWSETLLAAVQRVDIGSVEKCAAALEDLKVFLLEHEVDCGIQWVSNGLNSLCCPAYKRLLEDSCWCTAVAFDDYSVEVNAHVMRESYFNATACHMFEPETYPALVRGSACPIIPELSKVWLADHSDDVNTAACYWEFRTLFGDFSPAFLTETELTVGCLNQTTYTSFTATRECCAMIRPAIEVYNCSCMSCTEQNSIEARRYMQLLVDLAMDCDLALPGVHQDCDIQDAPLCAVNIDNMYLSHNLSAPARLSAAWNTWQRGHVLDQYEPLSHVYGEYVTEMLETKPVATFATFTTCAESEEHAPFVCDSYLDYLCIFYSNAWHSRDFCRDPQLAYLACDMELLAHCADSSMSFCDADHLCSTPECLYPEFIIALTDTLSTDCYQGQPVCADVDAECSQRLPAIRTRLEECATEAGSSCCQGGNVAEYFPTSMALCARFIDWSTEDAGASAYPGCARILYAVRQMDHRFNFAVGAQNISDVTFCNLTSQHSNCAANNSSLEYTFHSAIVGEYPASNLSSGCRIHDDCPYGFFCAMAVTSGATNSLCMPCWWCEGCDDSGAGPPWLLYPAAPTCGHCPCASECSPGCSNEMLNNGICDRECFNEECQYDAMTCASLSIDSSERFDCPEGARQRFDRPEGVRQVRIPRKRFDCPEGARSGAYSSAALMFLGRRAPGAYSLLERFDCPEGTPGAYLCSSTARSSQVRFRKALDCPEGARQAYSSAALDCPEGGARCAALWSASIARKARQVRIPLQRFDCPCAWAPGAYSSAARLPGTRVPGASPQPLPERRQVRIPRQRFVCPEGARQVRIPLERFDRPEGARQLLEGQNPGLQRTNHDQNSFEFYQFITTKNRIIGGMVMQVQRADYDTPGVDFHHSWACASPTVISNRNALDGGYSTDGIFQVGNEFYNVVTTWPAQHPTCGLCWGSHDVQEVARDQPYYYPDPDDLNDFGVPYLLKGRAMGGDYKTYPAVLDINLSQERAQEMLRFLEASTFIDSRTVKFSMQLLTFNGNTPFFTSCHFDITSSTDGSWRIFTEVRALDTVWFNGWLDVVRAILEIVFTIIVLKGFFSEVGEMLATKRATGSVGSHFKDIFNVLDAFAIFFMFMVIINYIILMVEMKTFTVDVRYNIYESLSGHNATGGHVNWLKLLDGGEGMSTLGQKLDDFNYLLTLKVWYHFFNGFAILTNLLRVLKLMDFHPDIGMVTRTMREAGTDLINFIGLLCTIVLIYAFMGYIVFGSVSQTFHRLDYSLLSCFVMMMGETTFSEDIPNLGGLIDQIVGLTFFYSFMVLVFLFLLSALLGIIVSAMENVKSKNTTPAEQKADLFTDLSDITLHYWRHFLALSRRAVNSTRSGQFSWQSTVTERQIYKQILAWDKHLRIIRSRVQGGGACTDDASTWDPAGDRGQLRKCASFVDTGGEAYSSEDMHRLLCRVVEVHGMDVLGEPKGDVAHTQDETWEEFYDFEVENGTRKISQNLKDAHTKEMQVGSLVSKIMKHVGREAREALGAAKQQNRAVEGERSDGVSHQERFRDKNGVPLTPLRENPAFSEEGEGAGAQISARSLVPSSERVALEGSLPIPPNPEGTEMHAMPERDTFEFGVDSDQEPADQLRIKSQIVQTSKDSPTDNQRRLRTNRSLRSLVENDEVESPTAKSSISNPIIVTPSSHDVLVGRDGDSDYDGQQLHSLVVKDVGGDRGNWKGEGVEDGRSSMVKKYKANKGTGEKKPKVNWRNR